MNLIDISSWQTGMSLSAMFAANPELDGVIVKATQGTVYVNPQFDAWTSWLDSGGKIFGVYHFCNGGDPEAEASHFYHTVKAYIGRGVPVADYEGKALTLGTAWLRRFLEKFLELSGVRCMIYCSLSVVQEQDFSGLTAYPLWIAQYADRATVNGFLDNPWQRGSVAPFPRFWMHQYTSCGRLPCWGGNLDFDKFYGTAEDWRALAGSAAPEPPAELKGPDPEVIAGILSGAYGNGPERPGALRAAGYDPDKCQQKVNELYAIALSCRRYAAGNLDYLDSIAYIMRNL